MHVISVISVQGHIHSSTFADIYGEPNNHILRAIINLLFHLSKMSSQKIQHAVTLNDRQICVDWKEISAVLK